MQTHRRRTSPPSLDLSGEFPSFYRKERHYAETADGWTLCITRYRPMPGPIRGALYGEPIILVHGFSQNRHAWTAGDFVTTLLSYGLDVFMLELRGHGLSSRDQQRRMHHEKKKPLPDDLDYGWDIDSYFLFDLPAAIAEVKRVSGKDRVFYCGHSLGGMLGYGYAGLHDDLAGLIAVGAPSDLGRDFMAVRLLAFIEPALGTVDAGLEVANAARRAWSFGRHTAARLSGSEVPRFRPLAFRYVPVDSLLRFAGRELARRHDFYEWVGDRIHFLGNLRRVSPDDVQWLLREGAEPEPRGVVRQMARWIRHGELQCYRTGFDFKSSFPRIRIPLAILYGDHDRLASAASTTSIYYETRSAYRVWKPVAGNGHVELTMGRDVQAIAGEVRDLIAFATERVESSSPR